MKKARLEAWGLRLGADQLPDRSFSHRPQASSHKPRVMRSSFRKHMVQQSLLAKLEPMARRYEELEKLLADPEVISNQGICRAYLKERGRLSKSAERYNQLKSVIARKDEAQALLSEHAADKDLVALAHEELAELEVRQQALIREIEDMVLDAEADSGRDAIMEIRAGTGGEEACLFAADLLRMYLKYAELKGWKTEILESHPTELQGIKEVVVSISGDDVFKHLQFESGGHRVQRVPVTEAGGRIHTSACTVAVMPEAEEIDVSIDEKDLEIEFYRSSGPGGQNVNKLSTAVRITHVPTGIVVPCQEERSQHKNRMKAMRILRSRVYEGLRTKRDAERSALRKGLIGSGDRSERVRTYNFPQNRVTDHRINFTLYDLEHVLLGEIDPLIERLVQHDRELRLRES